MHSRRSVNYSTKKPHNHEMPTDVIHVENLVKKFGSITAVDGIQLDVPSGQIFGFLGPNGAGKSTTIKILATLLRPTSGKAAVAGFDGLCTKNTSRALIERPYSCAPQAVGAVYDRPGFFVQSRFDVVANPNKVRQSIGLVFQDQSLDDRLTAQENLWFHAMLYDLSSSLFAERVEDVLRLVDLIDRRHSLVRTFSGGMKRRLEIARGLLHHPKVLFLDEPTLGLDPQTRNAILTFMYPGIIGMSILFTSIFSAVSIIWDREFGFLKEVLVAPVPRWAVALGKTFGGATISIIQATILILIAPIIGIRLSPAIVLEMWIMALLIGVALTALGIAIAARMSSMQAFQMVMNFLVMPLYFLSGAMFPITSAPPVLKALMTVNPLTYCVDGLRNIIFSNTLMTAGPFVGRSVVEAAMSFGLIRWSLVFDMTVVAFVAVALTAAGAYRFNNQQE